MDPGSHVGFQISTKNTNLVEDHPVNISGKLGSIVYFEVKLGTFCSFTLKYLYQASEVPKY
jgi:hypothetical protein